jgi:hypothetical protein
MMAFSTLSSTRPSIRPFQGQQARPFVQTNLNRKNQFAKRTTPVVRVLDLTSEAQFEAEVLQVGMCAPSAALTCMHSACRLHR